MIEKLSNEKKEERTLISDKQSTQIGKTGILRLIILGVIGGLAGMVAMDLVMVVEFLIIGLPIYTYLELIGSVLGGGVLLGVVMHVLLSLILGLIFITIVMKVGALLIRTVKKGLAVGFLMGAVTIVGCVPFAIIVDLPIVELLSFSTIPHLVWGAVCGGVVGYILHS